MALEVFAKLDDNGESAAEDHIFVGRKQDLVNVAKWLSEQFQNNRRKKKIKTLAEKFKQCSQLEIPYVRLTKLESREFNQAIKLLSETKRSKPLRKLLKILEISLWIY